MWVLWMTSVGSVYIFRPLPYSIVMVGSIVTPKEMKCGFGFDNSIAAIQSEEILFRAMVRLAEALVFNIS